jgi:hypothetical protein
MAAYFLQMLHDLRKNEDVLLYENILETYEQEEQEVIKFLADEYKTESLNYPFTPPAFDPRAALWAAKTVYIAAQLVLYRKPKTEDLPGLLPAFTGEITAAAMLSADLCLRFLPDLVVQLKLLDHEDALIPLLEDRLKVWHYSAIAYQPEVETLDLNILQTNNCLQQLYINRVIACKNQSLARHPAIMPFIKASLGIFTREFWNELNLEMLNIHE